MMNKIQKFMEMSGKKSLIPNVCKAHIKFHPQKLNPGNYKLINYNKSHTPSASLKTLNEDFNSH